MIRLSYTIQLLSDATPGSGLGSAWVDDLVVRGFDGKPCLAASHLKGLIRDRLQEIEALVAFPASLADRILGREAMGEAGDNSLLQFEADARSDAALQEVAVRLISRTALDTTGTIKTGSLRTVEAIPAGAVFRGRIRVVAKQGSAVDLAVRLAMLSIGAIGSSRTRGSGASLVMIEGEKRLPGELLRELHKHKNELSAQREAPAAVPTVGADADHGKTVWLRVIFEAESSICCPVTPTVGGEQGNLIRSDFAIPASAVQGAVLHRINGVDPALASACFVHSSFRCWPLLPTAAVGAAEEQRCLPWPVIIPLSHRMSKLPDEMDRFEFCDTAIEPYHWEEVAKGSPLKGTHGVLLRRVDSIGIWRSARMPRVISAHVRVNHHRSALFTVEAIAPLTFTGLICLPLAAAEVLQRCVEKDRWFAFGKGRTVRGGGTLRLEETNADTTFTAWDPGGDKKHRAFVLQSPAAIPDDLDTATLSCDQILSWLVADAGLGPLDPGESSFMATQATAGVRFGWKRAVGDAALSDVGRLRAVRVIEPGAVFVLGRPVDDVAAVMQQGLGGLRDRGYGALLPHPGKAERLDEPKHKFATLSSGSKAGQIGFELFKLAGERGPSASQISNLMRRLEQEPGRAIDYLDHQLKGRTQRTFAAWEPVGARLAELMKQDSKPTATAMRVWRDLTVGRRREEDTR